jgi:peptidoglycan/xylan/chitin deacetylase (PgdA/CDA1 family)
MRSLARLFCFFMMVLSSAVFAADKINIPILCYHNFNPTVPGSMNLTPERFEAQIKWLKDNGFTIIPLKEAVEYLQGQRETVPTKSIVITDDDGWQSAYTYMYPIAKKYHFPVTLFIYPQTISEGKHAMTWDELKELQQTGLFDIQDHTFEHPNFKQEKRKMSAPQYEKFVKVQLVDSKAVLEKKLGIKITLLAWPFGIYDDYLEQQAADAGYTMAFSIDAQGANRSYRPMAQPRYMIIQGLTMKTFENIMNAATES